MITNYENKMIKRYHKKFRVNVPLRKGQKAGDILRLETDKDGTPLDEFYRRRLRDAKQDNCFEPVVEKKKSKKKEG